MSAALLVQRVFSSELRIWMWCQRICTCDRPEHVASRGTLKAADAIPFLAIDLKVFLLVIPREGRRRLWYFPKLGDASINTNIP